MFHLTSKKDLPGVARTGIAGYKKYNAIGFLKFQYLLMHSNYKIYIVT